MNIFEYAAKNRLRFQFRGSISTEDLYALGVEDLDTIYKSLKREEKKNEEESLLDKKSEADVSLGVKIEIVKHIVGEKLALVESRKLEAAKKAKKEKILSILAEKEDAALKGKSEEELRKMLEDL